MIRYALIIACTAGLAAAEPPSISRIVPAAIAPGKSTQVSLHGDDLEQVVGLWTSFSAKWEKVTASNNVVVFRIEPLSKYSAGLGMLRVIGSNGVSSLKFVMLDGLSTITASKTNDSVASALILKPPTAIEGQCAEKRSAFFKFSARRGERIFFDVVARRMGSALDPVARLLDSQGRELLFCEDTPGASADCRFAFKFEKSGQYLLELRDTRYGGGSAYDYRLRVGGVREEPFPLPFMANDELSRLEERPPEVAEAEPNDLHFQTIKIPCAINGKLDKPKDRDGYEFEAKKGQHLIFKGKSRSLGSPCDLYLRLQNSNGKFIAESPLSGPEEASITNNFKESGIYQIVVEEAAKLGGPEFFYQLDLAPFRSGFGLSVDKDAFQVFPGGTFEVKVLPIRQGGYDGPIKISLEGAGESLVLATNLVTTKTNATSINITLADDLKPAQVLLFKIRGSAKIEGEEFSTFASTGPALRKDFPRLLWPPCQVDGWIVVGIKAKSK